MPNLDDARGTYAASLAFVSSRDELPLILNARDLVGCGVEVGVQEGLYSEHLLRHWCGAHLISVDPWLSDAAERYVDIANVPQAAHDARYDATRRRLAAFGTRSSVWRMTSLEASERIPHHSLDFVYLDARHDRASVLEDLEAWFDRVRPGGILAGHDYLDGVFEAGVFGVKSAVDAFFDERGLAVYATLLDEPWLTWMVRLPAPGHAEEVRSAPPARDTETPRTASQPRQDVTIRFAAHGAERLMVLSLDPSRAAQRSMLDALSQNVMYEPETSQLLVDVLRDGDTFVDVGTHVGFFSMLAASLVGPSGRVVSFEPEEENFRALNAHASLNGFANVEPVRAAVGAARGEADLWVNADNDGGHALWAVGRHSHNVESRRRAEHRRVPVTTLDAHFSERDARSLKLIKIDAEGSELHVLRGAEPLLRRAAVPYVVCEVNRFALEQMGASEDALREFMSNLGYDAHAFDPATGRTVPITPTQHVVSDVVFNLLFQHRSAPPVRAA